MYYTFSDMELTILNILPLCQFRGKALITHSTTYLLYKSQIIKKKLQVHFSIHLHLITFSPKLISSSSCALPQDVVCKKKNLTFSIILWHHLIHSHVCVGVLSGCVTWWCVRCLPFFDRELQNHITSNKANRHKIQAWSYPWDIKMKHM